MIHLPESLPDEATRVWWGVVGVGEVPGRKHFASRYQVRRGKAGFTAFSAVPREDWKENEHHHQYQPSVFTRWPKLRVP